MLGNVEAQRSNTVYRIVMAHNTKIKTIICDSFPELGRITAAQFVKQIQEKPNSVVSLPTGKTPEYFIKWTEKILHAWESEEIVQLRAEWGLNECKPDMSQVRFVQMDEFFPIHPSQENSFAYFVREQYIKGFGLSESKCMLMDTSQLGKWSDFPEGVDLKVLDKEPSSLSQEQTRQREILSKVSMYCEQYENAIRELGGLDFFLGGIGPDGHVAFNTRGSAFDSTTRILKLNYESMATSAESLGGMSVAERSAVITIGLGTIVFNPACRAIIFAAGEAKADVVKRALQSEVTALEPSHGLRALTSLSFILTKGASKHISQSQGEPPSKESILSKIQKGEHALSLTATIVHTEPHQDDIMLGYLPLILRARQGAHRDKDFFVCATSGFNSVSNEFVRKLLLETTCSNGERCEGTPIYDLEMFRQGVHLGKEDMMRQGLLNRISRTLSPEDARSAVAYLESLYPGQKPNKRIQDIKGICREFEAESLWFLLGWNPESVHHLRLSFYTTDIFNPQPDYKRDCLPIYDLLRITRPEIITVALDPESSGPDTHYKVLQAVTTAAREYGRNVCPDVKIWGYRNVWSQFDIKDVDMIIPISSYEMDRTHDLFMKCYLTQKTAEFPSHKFDGPFSKIVIETWKRQLDIVCELLQRNPFGDEVKGLLFMKEISVDELIDYSQVLSRSVNGSSS